MLDSDSHSDKPDNKSSMLPLSTQDEGDWVKTDRRVSAVERSFGICIGSIVLMALIAFCLVTAGADDGALYEYAGPLTNSIIAGLSTGIGGLVVLLMGIPSNEIMALVLGLAAGVMLTVSVFDMWLPAVQASFLRLL